MLKIFLFRFWHFSFLASLYFMPEHFPARYKSSAQDFPLILVDYIYQEKGGENECIANDSLLVPYL